MTPDQLFEIARLVVAAEIAKIHTTEWTPQLLYNDPLYIGMNGNWNGLLGANGGLLSKALSDVVTENFGKSKDVAEVIEWYSVFASGPGIFGLGSKVPGYDITNPKYPMEASITLARHSISPKNSSPYIACIHWCPICLSIATSRAIPNKIMQAHSGG